MTKGGGYKPLFYLKTDTSVPAVHIASGRFVAEDVWTHEEHTLDVYEIFICTHGSIYLTQQGELYPLTAGDGMLMLPGVPHKGYAPSQKGAQALWMMFSLEKNAELIAPSDADRLLMQQKNNRYFSGLNHAVLLPDKFLQLQIDRISVLFSQLLHLAQKTSYSKQGSDYILTSILIELTQQLMENYVLPDGQSTGDRRLYEVLEWIRHHIKENISLDDVADAFHYSKVYLARYFKSKMGITMQQYIARCRISAAKKLLCETDKTVREIAFSLGFPDDKYFLRLFKQCEAMTPKQFRRAYFMTHINNH